MLKKVIIKNAYTFTEEIIMDFENSNNQIYSIFGGNGTGKTNLLNSIRFINKSFNGYIDYNEVSKMVSKFNPNQMMELLAVYTIEGIDYIYELNINLNEIVYQNVRTKDKIIFEYSQDKSITEIEKLNIDFFNNDDIKVEGIMKIVKGIDNPHCQAIRKYTNANFIGARRFSFEKEKDQLFEFILNNKNILDELIGEIKKIDVGINNIVIVKNKNSGEYDLYFEHVGVLMPFSCESDGTKKYFILLSKFLYDINKYGSEVFMIDELELHFHPLLTQYFIEFFKKYSSKIQFIFTTHYYDIMDEKMLPKTNIIFLDKEDNITQLFYLSDFELRNDERHNWKKMYFQKRFGGIPHVTINS